jgi:hypothetical protein
MLLQFSQFTAVSHQHGAREVAYPRMALASQQMALKNEKATVAFHCAQVAVP